MRARSTFFSRAIFTLGGLASALFIASCFSPGYGGTVQIETHARGTCYQTLYGDANNNVLGDPSTACIQSLYGYAGADNLAGGLAGDLLNGGRGADWMTGGPGHNVFIYARPHDSAGMSTDTITDFDVSKDKIDLSAMCVYVGVACRFIGNRAFDGGAGEVAYTLGQAWRCDPVTGECGDLYFTEVVADFDGDGSTDFMVLVYGQLLLLNGNFGF